MKACKRYLGLAALGLALAGSLPAQIYTQSEADARPKPTRMVAPLYPLEMRAAGIGGTAIMTFVIDEKGAVTDCEVAENTDPVFGQAAYDAIRQWQFAPVKKAGHRVRVKMSMPFAFNIDNGAQQISATPSGANPYGFQKQGDHRLPEELRYDTPPQPDLLVPPVYPSSFLLSAARNRDESADVSFVVDPDGYVHQIKVLKTNAPQLTGFLTAALEASRFTPASKNKKACWAAIARRYTFNRYLPESGAAGELLQALRAGGQGLVPANALDHPLRPLYEVAPVYPESLRTKGPAGEAVVEFYIDRDGWARFPKVISATNEAFGWAAVTAISQWQFAPPIKNGKPEATFARIPFEFSPPKA